MNYIFKLAIGARFSRLLLYWSLLFLISVLPVQAQSPSKLGQFVLKATDHLALYQVDSDGELTLIANLPNTFGMEYTPNVEWNIPSWKQVVMSPNSTYLAYVAYHSQPFETALFIFDIAQKRIKEVNLPKGFGAIHWSPASDSIIIAPFAEYYDNSTINSIYVYNLPSDHLTELVDESNILNSSILWMPDSRHVVYVGASVSCQQPCVTVANLFITDRDGKNQVALTDLGTQISKDTSTAYDFCYPERLIWNNSQHRIYYSLNCTGANDQHLDMLYSVTLNQANRFEGELGVMFPRDTDSSILNIFPVGNKIYIAVGGLSQPLGGSEEAYSAARMLRLDQASSLTIINEEIFDSALIRLVVNARMSPDNHYLALIGFDAGKNKAGYLGIVNIDNRQTIVEQRASEQICHVEWLDNQKIIYTEFPDSQCNPYTEPGDTMIYDLQTNFSQKVNQAGEKLWLLQPPNVP